jgi:hypothetical protein
MLLTSRTFGRDLHLATKLNSTRIKDNMLRKQPNVDAVTSSILTCRRVKTLIESWDVNSIFHDSNLQHATNDLNLLTNVLIPDYLTRISPSDSAKRLECIKRLHLTPNHLRANFQSLGNAF